jgi:hypothetical protein
MKFYGDDHGFLHHCIKPELIKSGFGNNEMGFIPRRPGNSRVDGGRSR